MCFIGLILLFPLSGGVRCHPSQLFFSSVFVYQMNKHRSHTSPVNTASHHGGLQLAIKFMNGTLSCSFCPSTFPFATTIKNITQLRSKVPPKHEECTITSSPVCDVRALIFLLRPPSHIKQYPKICQWGPTVQIYCYRCNRGVRTEHRRVIYCQAAIDRKERNKNRQANAWVPIECSQISLSSGKITRKQLVNKDGIQIAWDDCLLQSRKLPPLPPAPAPQPRPINGPFDGDRRR